MFFRIYWLFSGYITTAVFIITNKWYLIKYTPTLNDLKNVFPYSTIRFTPFIGLFFQFGVWNSITCYNYVCWS